MPDITLKTISATEAPALFNVSPYVTRWMLYQRFANGVDLDSAGDARMSWGTKMQPLVLAQAAEDLRLEVRPNDETYHRRNQLGCTRDATIICPDRGPGALETKCCFDYATWMRDWNGGKAPPRHYEIQLQQQMLVGDDEPYKWGVIAAWVGGEVHYFERKPIEDLWAKLIYEAAIFFDEIENKREPEPFGSPVELPWLTKLFPTITGNMLDMSDDAAAENASTIARMYNYYKEQESTNGKEAEKMRAKLLALAKDHDEVKLPGGVNLRVSTTKIAAQVRKESVSRRLKVFTPEDFVPAETKRAEMPAYILTAG